MRLAVELGKCKEADRRRLVNAAVRHGGDLELVALEDRGKKTRFRARKSMFAGVSPRVSDFELCEPLVPAMGSSMPGMQLRGVISAYRRLTKSDKSMFSASPMVRQE